MAQFETYRQIDGARALAIPLAELGRALEASAPLRALLNRYLATFLLQVSYGLVSCAQNLMEARLAHWLLMCHDRVAGDEIRLTHEVLGLMISAQRSGVTVTLHALEGASMVRSTRGLVAIRDRSALAELAVGTYGVPEARYRALIALFGKSLESAARPENPR